jgi:predicted HicB family RNase H-like nuclease
VRVFHRPHPSPNTDKGAVASIRKWLEQHGVEPRRHFSGKFNLRISPDLHEKLAIAAQAQGKSINTLAQEALRDCVAS